MHNKKVLSKIDLGKYKKPNPYKDDIILSDEGQWKYPGSVTRIPLNEDDFNRITMENVPYMVWAQPNVGPGIMMEPEKDYYFDNADYVDEYPQVAKQGGSLKKNNTSRSIKATNKLFAQNYLFKKPGKKKIFDPNSKFYQEGGEVVEMELDDEDIELFRQGGYIVEDISVPQLTQAQEGKETGVESYTSWENAPEEYAPYVTNMEEVPVVAEAAPWAKLSNEYEKKNSKESFIESKKKDYLKKSNKGLNKMAGLSMDNFPKDVAINFANEYEYKKNNYVTKKLGNQKGFNPRRRDEWVEELSPGERKVVANSKYGNKLQPGYWNKALAGVQELGNTLLPGQPFQYNIPGLTKSEQKEMRDSSVSAVDILAPMDIPGAVVANYLKNTGLSTGSDYAEQPAIYSGQKMGNVDDTEAMALNPLNYVGLQEIPLLGYKGIKGAIKGAKALPGAIKASKESGLLSNAYKVNPLAFKANPKAYYRVLGKEGVNDALESGVIRANPKNIDSFSGEPIYDRPFFSKGVPFDRDWKSPFKNKKGKQSVGSVYPDETMVEVFGHDKFHKTGDLVTSPIDVLNSFDQGIKFYKRDWLKGYKEVPVELPGSPNTNYTKGVKTSEWLKNYQLAKELKSKELLSPSIDPKILARNPNLAKNVTKAALKKYNTTYRAVTPDINEASIDELLAMRNAGVTDFNNPEQIAKYMSTHIPIKTKGYRANPINPGVNQDLLYTGKYANAEEAAKSLKKYGTYMTEVRPQMDFTSDIPQEWIQKYYDELPFGVNNEGTPNMLLQENSNWQPGTIAGKRDWEYWPYVGNKGSKVLKAGKTKKLEQGGYVDTELLPEEIEWYKSQGYEVEELD